MQIRNLTDLKFSSAEVGSLTRGDHLVAILTISRQIGSLGDEVASALASKLGWELITRETALNRFLKPVAKAQDFHFLQESAKFYREKSSENISYIAHLEQSISDLTAENSVILVGFGSQVMFAGKAETIHMRIVAPESVRLERIKRQYQLTDDQAMRILITADRKHKRFVSTVFDVDLTEPDLYHLTLNTAQLSVDACIAAVLGLIRAQELQLKMNKAADDSDIIVNPSQMPDFKHPAEIEFARILDMYHIEWRYEPKTFPVEWDAEGNVTLAFSPDFYLPKFDTYLELTTMNQKYVTMKNRKARKVRELYPGTNVKIVYKKDFQSLVERFSGQGG